MNRIIRTAACLLIILLISGCGGLSDAGKADNAGASGNGSGIGKVEDGGASVNGSDAGEDTGGPDAEDSGKVIIVTEGNGDNNPGKNADDDRADIDDSGITVINEIGGSGPEDENNEVSANTEESKSEIKTEESESESSEDAFYITEITDDIFARIYGKSFKENCTLPREDLRYLHVLHKDINGTVHEGEMIVNRHIAEDVLEILKELYENDYPIEKIRLVDEYDADDELSMEDNNSSAFNFRFVPRTTKPSKHGMGLAVDINTLYNPYITTVNGKRNVDPVNGEPYADRNADFDYKIEKGDLCYNLFIEHGFKWGGEWKNSKDYQHFEIPDERIREWYPE